MGQRAKDDDDLVLRAHPKEFGSYETSDHVFTTGAVERYKKKQ
jgi:hypothetical protein